jgi:integrase
MFTDRKIAALTKSGRYKDELLRGLYLHVSAGADRPARSWVLRYEYGGRERMMGLGSADEFNLSQARERARDARRLLADHIDPLEAKRTARVAAELAAAKIMSFETAAGLYHEQHSAKWSKKHRAGFISSLRRFAFPIIGHLPVQVIDTPAVLRVIEPHWATKADTAARVRGRIEAVLDWCAARQLRTGDNPASWKTIGKVLPAVTDVAPAKHHAALGYTNVAAFMGELRAVHGVGARALEFIVLTATRTAEALGAQWSEFDLVAATWTIPAERMKGGKEHRVPLAPATLALLQGMPREDDNPHVFVGRMPGSRISDMTLSRSLTALRPDVTTHGFRSCFRDWAAELTSTPNHVVEMALAHTIGNAVEAAYRRGDLYDKRCKLMDAWAAYCSAAPATGADVIPIGRAR